MGTLGCINDMMRRDKENREPIRRCWNYIADSTQRHEETQEKEEAETHQLFKIKLIMLGIVLIAGVLIWIGITFL